MNTQQQCIYFYAKNSYLSNMQINETKLAQKCPLYVLLKTSLGSFSNFMCQCKKKMKLIVIICIAFLKNLASPKLW